MKPVNKIKYRCPECTKIMIRKKQFKYFWWLCSGKKCRVTAEDNKGKPEFLNHEQTLERDFVGQIQFIQKLITSPRGKILIRIIKKRRNLKTFSEKHLIMYQDLIQPVIDSILFTKCYRCNLTLNSEESLELFENTFLCDWCWGH
jgi:hypothetical protein